MIGIQNLPSTSQANSPATSKDPSWVAEIKARYGEAENLLKTFNPSRVAEFAMMERRCLTGLAPSLARVSRTYGYAVAKSWLEIQINAVGNYAGVREKQSIDQLVQTAETMMVEYPYLKLTEWMLFFHKLKAGTYGSFYGVVDGMRIGEAMRKFIEWRRTELQRIDREKALSENERQANERRLRWMAETYEVFKEYAAEWLLTL